ncbi:MAG: SsrA-binding protein SmpB [Candidatus Margulisbacteria bacterium]|jgi:SsrA-binding protein|nr:SsrA-binding protein SmpB [Candidatus Margulisiibacteriota bacterium]
MEIVNRKAGFDYAILETIEAGIVLAGCEVKSIRANNASIKESYARAKGPEIYLVNMYIAPYFQGNIHNPPETRERKLLLKRGEINKLLGKIQQKKLYLVPLKVYLKKNRYVKVLLGLGKPKKLYDKKEKQKQRDIDREIRRDFKAGV